jgi:hypothetical protein
MRERRERSWRRPRVAHTEGQEGVRLMNGCEKRED